MTKLLLSFVLIFGCLMSTNAATTANIATTKTSASYPEMRYYWGYLEGRLGSDYSAMLFYDGSRGRGWYSFAGLERNIRLASYNRSTGTLILKAYDKKGKYIGQFVGKCTERYGEVYYKGTFTNYKGSKITFDLVQTFVGD